MHLEGNISNVAVRTGTPDTSKSGIPHTTKTSAGHRPADMDVLDLKPEGRKALAKDPSKDYRPTDARR